MLSEIKSKYPDADRPSLEIGEFSDPQVTLQIKQGKEDLYTIGPQASSGLGQQNVSLQEDLTSQEKDLVTAAFGGQQGNLIATYTTSFSLAAEIDVTIAGDIAHDLKELAPEPPKKSFFGGSKPAKKVTLAECLKQVNDSIAAGRLKMTIDATPNVSEELRSKVEGEAKTMIAREDLLATIDSLGATAGTMTEHSVSRNSHGSSGAVKYSVSRSLDVGQWFSQHGGGDALIQQAASALSEPNR